MRLESALFTSREGLTSHGQAISVIGDNISNSSTTGYKASRAEFADLMGEVSGDRVAETVAGAGDGAQIRKVRVLHDTGVIESTGRQLDVGIAGGGFFMVGDAADPQYTRAGAFEINGEGFLVNSNGESVLGYNGADTAALGPINMLNVSTAGSITTNAQIIGNLDAGADLTTVPENPESFNEISRSESYSVTQDVYDSLGERHTARISFFKTAPNTWTAQAYIDAGDVGGEAGTPQLIGATTLGYDGTGLIPEGNLAAATITATPAYSNGALAGNFTIDLSGMSQYAGGSTIANMSQDGIGTGQITAYEFGTNGKIVAVLDNGLRSQVGTLPLATFRNLDGLVRSGAGTFSRTAESGDPTIGIAGEGALGGVEGQALERSTVDIADQFVNMMLIQRGYQANSQVLGVANEMLQGTIQLIR